MVCRLGSAVSTEKQMIGGSSQGTNAGQELFLANANGFNERFPVDKDDYVTDQGYVDDVCSLARLVSATRLFHDDNGQITEYIYSTTLQQVMNEMLVFAEKKSFNLNVQKTKVMVFGRSQSETCLKIKAGGAELDNVKEFKLLGLWLDPMLTLSRTML